MAKVLLCLLFLCFFSISPFAKRIGIFGNLFEITEESPEKVMLRELSKIQNVESNIKERMKGYLLKESWGKIEMPECSMRLRKEIDPVHRLDQDIKDIAGKVIVKKGSKVNILEKLQGKLIEKPILLISGTRKGHAELAKYWIAKYNGLVLLTTGNPVLFSTVIGKKTGDFENIFFDYGGNFVQRFHINALPAAIWQDGKRILVEQFPQSSPPNINTKETSR